LKKCPQSQQAKLEPGLESPVTGDLRFGVLLEPHLLRIFVFLQSKAKAFSND
jgi:hypothetical protein